MKWVTWQNVGIDRIGCAWLIRKLIDKNPEFIFIPEGSTSVPKGAEPFDIPGAKLSVYQGIGHAPFYEDAARFNTELAAFVREANKTKMN